MPTNTGIRTKLNETTGKLRQAGIEHPDLSAAILIAAVVKCPRLELYLRFDEGLAPEQSLRINELAQRLAAHEPIQYVLGQTGFMGRPFKCDARALIPRPETEELVEWISGYEPLWKLDYPSVIDIGTGNGCIIISMALEKEKGKFRAADISGAALELARENARLHKVEHLITFIHSDSAGNAIPGDIDAVISNPPYVRSADYQQLPEHIRAWEPRSALDGGEDGLQVIVPLARKAFEILKPGRFLFMEIGSDQWLSVHDILIKTGFRSVQKRRDHAGHDRMVMAVK